MCSSALMLVAWRHRFAAFFIPPFLMRFVGRFLQDHLVLDPIDPARRNAVMRSMRVGRAFGQDDPITGNLIDLSDMLAVADADVHMFGYYYQEITMPAAQLTPGAESLFNLLLFFLALL